MTVSAQFRRVLVALAFILVIISSVAHADSTVGSWSQIKPWPIGPIHGALLPNGQVLFWGGEDQSGDFTYLWNPATDTVTPAGRPGYDIFCAGHSFLQGGELLVTGGHIEDYVGLPNASRYQPSTNTWTSLPNMNAGRWYPSNLTLPNGDVLVHSGTIDLTQWTNKIPQIWQRATQTWRDLTTAVVSDDLYPWLHITPEGQGRVFRSGPSNGPAILDTTGTGRIKGVSPRNVKNRQFGSSVMYEPGKILVVGGGAPVSSAEVIDIFTWPTPVEDVDPPWRLVGSMANARRQMNATLLPDGTVLATGGTSGPGFNDTTRPVLAAEVWNPATEQWTTLASQTVGRFYHSWALLLPDGRVLSAGGNTPGPVLQSEVFSPPYLFKGPRPTITSAPDTVTYAQWFTVMTPDAAGIRTIKLIRLGSVTHAYDESQLISNLIFNDSVPGGLSVRATTSRNQAPPGHYMLFILNAQGVPSVAKIIQLQ